MAKDMVIRVESLIETTYDDKKLVETFTPWGYSISKRSPSRFHLSRQIVFPSHSSVYTDAHFLEEEENFLRKFFEKTYGIVVSVHQVEIVEKEEFNIPIGKTRYLRPMLISTYIDVKENPYPQEDK